MNLKLVNSIVYKMPVVKHKAEPRSGKYIISRIEPQRSAFNRHRSNINLKFFISFKRRAGGVPAP